MTLLGIPIDILSREEVLHTVGEFLDAPGYHRIVTVNPEFLLLAEKNPDFRETLLAADLRVADGVGITLASSLFSSPSHSRLAFAPSKRVQGEGGEGLSKKRRFLERFPGADLMEALLEIANHRKLSVYLAVRADGLSSYDEVRSAILKRYLHLKIRGLDIDSCSLIGNWKLEIGNSAIVLCNFGAPAQELFLANLKNEEVESRVSMGVGGSFDYLTGKQKRAPKCLRMIGLEWLWRLILQPRRWKRIYNAVIVFPIKMLFSK